MERLKGKAALFDLDGVIFDTESQYDIFWGEQGRRHLPQMPEFSRIIKGTTLAQILSYFEGEGLQQEIEKELNIFERDMPYKYIAGAKPFLKELRRAGVKLAIVTSSNDTKMGNVFREHPDFMEIFDTMITANKVTKSKPDPQCYLLAAAELGIEPQDCVVFEDSFHGLESGNRAYMRVIGLATTNPRETIEGKAHLIIDNFENADIEKIILG